MKLTVRVALLLLTTVLYAPAAAHAVAPSNDERATPAPLGALPAQLSGTTDQATRDATDPPSLCAAPGPQVWYRFVAAADGRVAVRLRADGDLDAALDVYLSERSQTRGLSCDVTDAHGLGAADFTVTKDQVYLIAVSQLPNSVAGTFTLTAVTAQAPPRPPGRPLPSGGADTTLDRVGNVQDAFSVRMREGRSYRLRLSGRNEGEQGCGVSGALYAPVVTSFDVPPASRFGCDAEGYATFTPGPGEGGRYSVLLTAARGTRTLQTVHLEVAGAGADDIAPGVFLANRTTRADALNGARIDALDLYRFSIARRSDLKLVVATAPANAFDLEVLNDRGRRVQCACGATGPQRLTRQLAPGRYFVAVRARDGSHGTYTLRRVSRTLTHTTVAIASRTKLGASTKIRVRVRPAVRGPITIVLQRFDPFAGWIFYRQQRTRVAKGTASITFVAPSVGRWRARATYVGTVGAGPSVSGFAQTLVTAGRAKSSTARRP